MSTAPDLRQQILDASVSLIETQGLAALSMREVARRAGVSHQAPYHYFPDRQAILAAVAGEGFRRLGAALHTVVTAPSRKGAIGRLEAGGRAYVGFALSSPGYFRVMFRPELVDLDAHPEALAEAQGAFAALQALVGGLVEEGVIEAKEAPAMVTTAWSMVHGLSSLLLDGPLGEASGGAQGLEQAMDATLGTFTRLLRRASKG